MSIEYIGMLNVSFQDLSSMGKKSYFNFSFLTSLIWFVIKTLILGIKLILYVSLHFKSKIHELK